MAPRATLCLTIAFVCALALLAPAAADAQIKRARSQVRALRAESPCPATGL